MNIVTPVILAGGVGTRLWPLSRKSYPKQFSKLATTKTLFQDAVGRVLSSDLLDFSRPMILTNHEFRFIVSQQLNELRVEPEAIIIEPSVRDTAPAILVAALYALRHDPDAVLLVCPSDHVIRDNNKFHMALRRGISKVSEGKIILLGIKPYRAETGYGYIECSQDPTVDVVQILNFIEKPSFEQAEKMFKEDNFLWNAGIFLFKASDLVAAFESYANDLLEPTKDALNEARIDLGFTRLDEKAWSRNRCISIDYAILEEANNIMAVPFYEDWSDLGTWAAVWEQDNPDNHGVVASANSTAIECKNTLIRSEGTEQHVVGLGLDNIIAIATADAVLVANKSLCQEIKSVVPELERLGVDQATKSNKDHRPWGWFEVLTAQANFKVKRIFVYPHASLSLQSHKHRSEHWIVVSGAALVTVDSQSLKLHHAESIYVPIGSVHQLQNEEDEPLELIEVQTGSYLGEDDIIRYQDRYARS